MIVALCGGVGGSKLALGLYRSLPPDELTVIVNTADDLEFCGLHVSPDLDTVTYTLAGLARRDVGWGIEGDTFAALSMLERYGAPGWFQVGDRDLATDVLRTSLLRRGESLTAITQRLTSALGVRASVLPMTDAPVSTRLLVKDEWLHFQEYFVQRRHRDAVSAIRYDGIESSGVTDEVRTAISDAETIIIVNSNPVLSVLPILAVAGIHDLVVTSSATRVAVSPIIGNAAIAGPAGELLALIGQPASSFGVAGAYSGILDGILIDMQDAEQVPAIEALGLQVQCTDLVMGDDAGRVRLAEETLAFAGGLTIASG